MLVLNWKSKRKNDQFFGGGVSHHANNSSIDEGTGHISCPLLNNSSRLQMNPTAVRIEGRGGLPSTGIKIVRNASTHSASGFARRHEAI